MVYLRIYNIFKSEEKAHESVKLGAFDIWALGIKLLVVNILVGILFPQFWLGSNGGNPHNQVFLQFDIPSLPFFYFFYFFCTWFYFHAAGQFSVGIFLKCHHHILIIVWRYDREFAQIKSVKSAVVAADCRYDWESSPFKSIESTVVADCQSLGIVVIVSGNFVSIYCLFWMVLSSKE